MSEEADYTKAAAFRAGFDFAKLLGNPGFRARWEAAGGGRSNRVIPVAADTTVADILARLNQPQDGEWEDTPTFIAMADASAPHGFRIWKEMP